MATHHNHPKETSGAPPKTNNPDPALQRAKLVEDMNKILSQAQLALDPCLVTAFMIEGLSPGPPNHVSAGAIMTALKKDLADIRRGNIDRVLELFYCGAQLFQAISSQIARHSFLNDGRSYIHGDQAKLLLQLDKAKRLDLQALLEAIRKWPSVVPSETSLLDDPPAGIAQLFVGPPTSEPKNAANELLSPTSNENMDCGSQGKAGDLDRPMEAMAKSNGAKDRARQDPQLKEQSPPRRPLSGMDGNREKVARPDQDSQMARPTTPQAKPNRTEAQEDLKKRADELAANLPEPRLSH